MKVVKVDLYSNLTNEFITWTFKVNTQGYITHNVGQMEAETLYDLGEIKESELLDKVMYLISCWKCEYKNLVVTT